MFLLQKPRWAIEINLIRLVQLKHCSAKRCKAVDTQKHLRLVILLVVMHVNLKYLGIILDHKLNWKPQIEKLAIQLSKLC